MENSKESIVKEASVLVPIHTGSKDANPSDGKSHGVYIEKDDTDSWKGPPIEYDETDDTSVNSAWCGPVDWFLHEFLHDNTALYTLTMYFVLSFIGLCFGPLTLPLLKRVRQEGIRVPEDALRQIESVDMVGSSLSHLKTIRNAGCFLLTTMGMMVCTLFAVLTVRYITIKLIVQPLYHISYLAVITTYAMDPAAAYCLWTVANYALLRKFVVPVHDGDTLAFYRFTGLGEKLAKWHEIETRCYAWTNSIFQLFVLIALRKLVLSSLLFLFEVTFLPNYSGELGTYLREQATLRRFNIAWMNFVNCARDSDHYAVIAGVNTSNRILEKLPAPDTPITYNHKVYYDASHFNIFRQPMNTWRFWRRKDDMRRKRELPQFCKERWIQKCMSNMLTNWSALHHMVHNPPELIFTDFYVPLVSKKTVQEYSKLLFEHIYETMSALSRTEATEAMAEEIKSTRSTKAHIGFTDSRRDRAETHRYDRAISQATNVTMKPSAHTDGDSGEEDNNNITGKDFEQMMAARDEKRLLTRRMFSLFQPSVVDSFFTSFDTGNCGAISSTVFVQNVLYICSLRKRLMSALKNQRSILGLVHRLLSTATWFLLCVIYLMTFRVNKNIVLPSVIGFLSAMIVALSYMYTSFITAIIFVVLSNPYNVGDRIRVNNGEAMYVTSINTYNTVFRCAHGKIFTYQNAQLSTMHISNETRARHAIAEVQLRISASTTPAALKQLIENIKSFVNGRPREYVRDGCFVYVSRIQVGHYYDVNVMVTFLDNWVIPLHIFMLQKPLLMYILNQCNMLGITYREPTMPVLFNGPLPSSASQHE
ncbi:mechanosensitive ion channel family protein [Babesia ovis]|uniref:Mechanosensitive ion channel family protein n=1 Tax=Babesia ovis TaxID=5869 RepID=A0A9W5TDT0_BABOV|nr:mechanosensitive ion channel family protein [Babesia ovis]